MKQRKQGSVRCKYYLDTEAVRRTETEIDSLNTHGGDDKETSKCNDHGALYLLFEEERRIVPANESPDNTLARDGWVRRVVETDRRLKPDAGEAVHPSPLGEESQNARLGQRKQFHSLRHA